MAKDYSQMKNGTKLLEMLRTEIGGQWVVLHGHQHYPAIQYGHGDSASAIIFSAGSFSRRLNELVSRESVNQFYHIHFPIDRYSDLGWHGCGICHAWDWTPGSGWAEARGTARIPHRCGFGCRLSADVIARQISTIVKATKGAVNWEYVLDQIPPLSFVLPSEVRRIIRALPDHGIKAYGDPLLDKCQLSMS